MKKILILVFIIQLAFPGVKAQWVVMNNGMVNIGVASLASGNNNIFAGTVINGVYLSTDYGSNWTQTTLPNMHILSLAVDGNNIYAGSGNTGVYSSSNNGTNWNQTALNDKRILSMANIGNIIFAGTWIYGVYTTTDNGANWIQTSLGGYVYSLAVNGNYIFAGKSGSGVSFSTDNGANWTQTPLNNQSVYSLAITGNNIFAGTASPGNGVFLSTNNGLNWIQTSLNNQQIYSLAVSGNIIFAGTYTNGVYISTDNGTSWVQRNEGFSGGNLRVNAFCIINNYIYAGLQNYSVYRRSLVELTGINIVSNETPKTFSLSQNFPNPFNPSTKIKFTLPKSSFTKLVVYDALGRQVESFVNRQLNAGRYEVDWDASNRASGIYYYKLEAESFTETKRMVLLK